MLSECPCNIHIIQIYVLNLGKFKGCEFSLMLNSEITGIFWTFLCFKNVSFLV